MKKLVFIAAIFCTITAVSCKKEKQITGDELFMGAYRNNASWLADPITSKTPGDSLQIKGLNSTDNSAVIIKMPFHGKGTYAIGADDAIYTITEGVSGPGILYRLDATKTNTVKVTDYNVATNITKGLFELHFVKVQGSSDTGNNIDMTSGQFWLQVPF
ncbi:hypothetical protein [Mucilaginibacter sp.]|jgi:hypothetical protein|uniref:hypothetical protein n=1 Tax=Mucilaginibacter sp. TaxID=1882438 RepID=UPI002BE9A6EE|nr:hypothetical protein [Mucilaginibacter sp.]HTI59745.1 hypothetical protein [Mucilaginibacter sp.]